MIEFRIHFYTNVGIKLYSELIVQPLLMDDIADKIRAL